MPPPEIRLDDPVSIPVMSRSSAPTIRFGGFGLRHRPEVGLEFRHWRQRAVYGLSCWIVLNKAMGHRPPHYGADALSDPPCGFRPVLHTGVTTLSTSACPIRSTRKLPSTEKACRSRVFIQERVCFSLRHRGRFASWTFRAASWNVGTGLRRFSATGSPHRLWRRDSRRQAPELGRG